MALTEAKTDGLTRAVALERAETLAAHVSERRLETEQLRRVPEVTIEEFVASGRCA